jgi:hypothetical protein
MNVVCSSKIGSLPRYARFRLKKPIEPGAQSLRTNLRGVANSKMQLTIAALKLDLNKYHKQETNKPVKVVTRNRT